MNPTRSLLALAATLLLAVGAAACGSDDEKTTSDAQTPSTEQSTTTDGTTETTTTKTSPPEDEGDNIVLEGGQPVGGLQKLKISAGDEAKITVESDQDANIHLHGYDIEKPAKPGAPAKFEFKADIPGIFTIEVEDSGTEIAEIEVS